MTTRVTALLDGWLLKAAAAEGLKGVAYGPAVNLPRRLDRTRLTVRLDYIRVAPSSEMQSSEILTCARVV